LAVTEAYHIALSLKHKISHSSKAEATISLGSTNLLPS